MQTPEKKKFSLRSLAGGKAHADLELIPGTSPDIAADSLRLAEALRRVLGAAGCSLAVRAPRLVDTTSDSKETAAGAVDDFGTMLRTDIPQPATDGDLSVCRLRTFARLLPARAAEFDLMIVTPDAGYPTAQVFPPAAAESANDRAMRSLDAVARYAMRLGRQRVSLLLPSQSVNHDDEALQQIDDLADRYPSLEFETLTNSEATRLLMNRPSRLDVLVCEDPVATILRETAAALTGAASLATRIRISRGEIFAGPDFRCLPAHAAAAESLRSSAVLLATTDLLAWLGETDAARRISSAWYGNLARGLHTEEFKTLSVCAREIDIEELAATLIEQLGQKRHTPGSEVSGAGGEAGGYARRRQAGLRLVKG